VLNVLDLFSGIGGFSLGLEATGKFKTIAFCETDRFCQKVLQKHWKDIPIHEDIKKLDGTKIKADVVVGGFPCQSFSIAGKQKGKDDERYLWDEMFRVIKEVKPRWIIGENVSNLINISNGEILQGIHNDLESQGFEVQTFNISASSQGAWHKRSRVWIIAANTKSKLLHGCSSSTKHSPKKLKRLECNKGKIRDKIWSKTKRCSKQNLQFTNTKCNKQQNSTTRQSGKKQVRRFYFKKEKQTSHDLWSKTSRCDAPSRQQTWWEAESKFFGIPHGLSAKLDTNRNDRIKALGNSIVPQIITEIGKAIVAAEHEFFYKK